jgi:hypothetical protein
MKSAHHGTAGRPEAGPDELMLATWGGGRYFLEKGSKAQDAEREFRGTEWQEGGWVFTQPTGRPADPRADHTEWKSHSRERANAHEESP